VAQALTRATSSLAGDKPALMAIGRPQLIALH